MEDKDWTPKKNPQKEVRENIGCILIPITILMFVIGINMMLFDSSDNVSTGTIIFLIATILSFYANTLKKH